jgi:hypothetical protein
VNVYSALTLITAPLTTSEILEDASAKLSGAVRSLLAQLKLELDHLQMRIDEADALIPKIAGENRSLPTRHSVRGVPRFVAGLPAR